MRCGSTRRTSMGTVSDRKFAVVTGASSGIGFELARQCAKHGYDVLVCAEDGGIHSAATQIAAECGTSVEAVQQDLRTRDGVEALARTIKNGGRPVDALLLNAGVGVGGAFIDTSLERE